MTLLLGFAGALLVAVLVSARARRTVLSTAVLFLAAGFLLGITPFAPTDPSEPVISRVSELALFSVLFTDGMRTGLRDLTSAWRLPGRALLFGLPLTLLGTALLGRYVAGLPWPEALLLGAALSPTDPVFAAAIVGREEVPLRLRRLLNVESGLNDGLALPVVIVLLAAVGADEGVGLALVELVEGVALGVAVPWLAIRLERSRFFSVHGVYEPLNGFAIGVLVYALGATLHANLFLAAFSAGVTVASASPSTRAAFHEFGETVTELLKLAALFVFGLLVSPEFLAEIPVSGYVFALLALLAVRPLALSAALAGSELDWRERAVAAWFGPKGFASVVYGLLILQAGIARGDELFHLIALTTAASILAHSSTDVLVAHWLGGRPRSAV
jgi:NhaP-type Na+/H+ or K+/H+ antiporter